MIECPPLHTSFPAYVILQHVLSAFTIPINLLAMYCIVFRSPRAMNTYRWHLLWHQFLASLIDFFLGVYAIPIYLVPFPLVFPKGLMTICPVIPTHVTLIIVILLITQSLAATIQLFVYRYLKVTGRRSFPAIFLVLVAVSYVICASPSIGFEVIHNRNQAAFLHELELNYSCIDQALINTALIVGYPPGKIGLFVGLPVVLLNAYMINICAVLIYKTRRYLQGNTISASAARLERRFLFTLILQVTIPIVIVQIPGMWFMYIQAAGIYGFEITGLLCIFTLSMHGGLCGLILICLTPSYRNLILRKKTKGLGTPSSFEGISVAPRRDELRRSSSPGGKKTRSFMVQKST